MQKILILRGLPASGKSTYAKELIAKEPGRWVRTNKDDLRALLHGGKWSKENEKFIISVRDNIIEAALMDKKNVIVDDTNFAIAHEIAIRKIADKYKVEVEVVFFDVPVEECITRDAKRPNPVGTKVIYEMYVRHIKSNKVYQIDRFSYVHDSFKPKTLLIDLDGTATFNLGDRGFFEWDKVHLDSPNIELATLLNALADKFTIVYVSGRDEVCRVKTCQWLIDNNFPYQNILFMRPEGDMRADEIVKRELYDKFIKDKFDIWGVFDDRPKVIRMWRSLGFMVYNCGDGIEF